MKNKGIFAILLACLLALMLMLTACRKPADEGKDPNAEPGTAAEVTPVPENGSGEKPDPAQTENAEDPVDTPDPEAPVETEKPDPGTDPDESDTPEGASIIEDDGDVIIEVPPDEGSGGL